MDGGLKIGELARRAGVTAKAIRFYERKRILPPARRATNRYRLYGNDAVEMLRFIKQATGLGLTDVPDIHVEEIDVAANPAVAVKYRVMATPAIAINGRLMFTGIPREDALLARLREAAGASTEGADHGD